MKRAKVGGMRFERRSVRVKFGLGGGVLIERLSRREKGLCMYRKTSFLPRRKGAWVKLAMAEDVALCLCLCLRRGGSYLLSSVTVGRDGM